MNLNLIIHMYNCCVTFQKTPPSPYYHMCVCVSTFSNFELKCDTISFGTISFDNSSITTTEEDNFRDALFETVSSKYLSIGSFLLRGDVRIH